MCRLKLACIHRHAPDRTAKSLPASSSSSSSSYILTTGTSPPYYSFRIPLPTYACACPRAYCTDVLCTSFAVQQQARFTLAGSRAPRSGVCGMAQSPHHTSVHIHNTSIHARALIVVCTYTSTWFAYEVFDVCISRVCIYAMAMALAQSLAQTLTSREREIAISTQTHFHTLHSVHTRSASSRFGFSRKIHHVFYTYYTIVNSTVFAHAFAVVHG